MDRGLCFGVVEDNREDFATLCRLLGPEHEVRRWQSGEQAVAAFRPGGLDELAMLFVDLNLPGMDGVELVRELRSAPGGDRVKIVMVSGSREPGVADRARAAGVDRFEGKGETLADLRGAIERCLGELDAAGDAAAPVRPPGETA